MSEEEAQRFAAQTMLIEKMTKTTDPAMAWHLGKRITYRILSYA